MSCREAAFSGVMHANIITDGDFCARWKFLIAKAHFDCLTIRAFVEASVGNGFSQVEKAV